ncbi:ATP-binding cassette domain-containing protein [Lichenicola cladoniae]|uniref:ATP-binding cassette domain-containing protein n=1 Tax=Lichenicola cladoniae TaxID=1484109 RepID=A0A6M8HTY3_9PROT|nr:ABC transporter transmembrane domain-containing protein [Lichenicola cladoniae]NPD67749.1 ATP-binding cassette domain-containing protein [Acetobacteraceae bacterium]QKE91675.1 ATP-binding cassette domain-containing protein [Lichenicola cladoniae]
MPTPRIGSLGLLLPYMRPYVWRSVGATAALMVAAGLVLALGQGVRRLIDLGFASGSMAHLDRAALLMFIVVAGLAVATFLRFYLVSWLGERIAADLRRDLFERVISLSPSFFETARTGDILTRLTADISVLQALIGSAMSQWLRNAILLVGSLAMLLVTSPKLACLIMLVVPLVLLPLVLFGRRERRLSRSAQDRIADLGAYAEETINALRTVQAFTHEPIDRARFGVEIERSVAAAVQRIRTRATLIFAVILLGFGAIVFSLWVGGRDVIAGRLSGGDLSAFIFYAVLLASSGAQMSELWGELQRAGGAADRLRELLAERPSITAPARPEQLPAKPEGRVSFQDITFRYPARPDTASLSSFSLEMAPGETVALVGPSGAGKTTVLQLLLRFYDPAEGVIRLDGVDISQLSPADLRGRIGIVPQDPVIFSTTAMENIRYGRPGATDAEVRAAGHAAHADFLEDLPEGYHTFLGEKGVRLSGGQRQRVAIARAILRDPPVLLLDEATSALDAESEQAVQAALVTLSRNRTTLVVAHRLATVRNADRIVVIEAGRVVATGTHDSLIRDGGIYARLAGLQFLQAS